MDRCDIPKYTLRQLRGAWFAGTKAAGEKDAVDPLEPDSVVLRIWRAAVGLAHVAGQAWPEHQECWSRLATTADGFFNLEAGLVLRVVQDERGMPAEPFDIEKANADLDSRLLAFLDAIKDGLNSSQELSDKSKSKSELGRMCCVTVCAGELFHQLKILPSIDLSYLASEFGDPIWRSGAGRGVVGG